MKTSKRSRRTPSKDEEEASNFGEPRWVNVVVMAIVAMTGISLFFESQSMHNQAFQSLLSGKMTAESFLATRSLEGSPRAAISPGQYPPFSCPRLLKQMKTKVGMQRTDPNKGMIRSRRTTTVPPFYISLHEKSFDITRWTIMETGEYYERKLASSFQEVLQSSPPGARVLDVGANIGFFTLLSAAQGPFVLDSFEPNLKNRMRFCESLNMNQWFRTEFNNIPPTIGEGEDEEESPIVNLYPYGVGQEEGHFVFKEDNNPGMGLVTKAKTTPENKNGVHIVTLDSFAKERGWFDSKPHVAILKIDVEGNECQVIEGAKEFLKTNMVHNIFMEISVRTKPERRSNIPCLQYLSGDGGYRLSRVGGWQGPGTNVNWPNEDALVEKILGAADKEAAKQLNLWWKKIGVNSHTNSTAASKS